MKHATLRTLCGALAALLLATPLSGLAEAPAAEEFVQEAPEFELGLFETPADPEEDDDAPLKPPAADFLPVEAEPVDAPAEPEVAQAGDVLPEEMRFSETLDVSGATWSGVNLTRAPGFTGPLFRVSGVLTLSGVRLNGVSAAEADLNGWVELLPKASVVVADEAPLSLSAAAIGLNKGGSATLTLYRDGVRVKAGQARWKSENAKVASVTSAGKVKAVKAGVTAITATFDGLTARCLVSVAQPVTGVTLSPRGGTIDVGATLPLTANLKPDNATWTDVVWTSTNEAVARVDADGTVHGVGPGTATVAAKALSGKSAKVKITVVQPVTGVELPAEWHGLVGKSATLSAEILPANATNKKLTWASSNAKVAKVSAKGVVKGVAPGSCVITVKANNGLTAQCAVTITQPVTSVNIAKKQTVALYNAVKLTATVKPDNASDKRLTWASSNPSVADVDVEGNVYGFAPGSATITVQAADGRQASCAVTVVEVLPTKVDFEKLYLTLRPGESAATRVSVQPADASNRNVVYASLDPAVATVDESGRVTAVGTGSTTIVVTAAATAKVKNTCKVCVIAEGAPRMAGIVIGINPGHQDNTIFKKYPIAPGSSKKAYGCKVGACGHFTRVNEYETNLAIGLKLMRILEERGATVVITRTSNHVSITNIERATMLNEAHVDVALQLHCDAVDNASRYGIQNFIRTTGDWYEESYAISECLLKDMCAATGGRLVGTNKSNGYTSLNYSTTPSILLEMGYISNKEEDRLLASDDYREKMALGIADGLCRYFGR